VIRPPAAGVCARAAHAVLYRTLTPRDPAHAYFGWYQPAVAGLSVAAVVALLVLVAVAAMRPLRVLARVRVPTVRALAASSVGVFLVQEAIERSVAVGHPAVEVLAPSQWLTLFAAVSVASWLFVLALRLARRVARSLVAAAAPRLHVFVARWSVSATAIVRARPLALGCALRGPPLLSS
jgi:hypothetical protein